MSDQNLYQTATDIASRASSLLFRSIKNPDRLYRVNQLSPSLVPSFLVRRSISSDAIAEKKCKVTGILAFINTKSGGGQGVYLLEELRKLLGNANVYELGAINVHPELILKNRNYENSGFKIIAGGGDGTSAWIFDSLDKAGLLYKNAVAVIPLGTGNDMAGFLKWGYTFDISQSISELVENVLKGECIKIDRWLIHVISDVNNVNMRYNVFNNYISIGLDAAIALKFHTDRNNELEENGNSRTRLKNIYQYTSQYMRQVLNIDRTGTSFADSLDLECDGVCLNTRMQYVKPDTLLILNIRSYAGGCRPWGSSSELSSVPYHQKWREQTANDGYLEIIAYSAIEFSDVAFGGRGHRIAQCKQAKLKLKSEIPIKVDGEPVLLKPCIIKITRHNQAIAIKKPTKKSVISKFVSTCGINPKSKNNVVRYDF